MEPPDPDSPRRGVTLAPLDPPRVGRRFVTLYALSYAGGSLLFLGPLLVSLALKVNDLVGIDDAPKNLALVTGVGSLLAIVSNPLFGRLSDRTTSALGMRRPWMITGLAGGAVGTLTVALAPNIGVVLVGWCIAQVFLNALLAAQAAILPDQVPTVQRGVVSGILGICLPVASVAATYLVQAFEGRQLMTFLAPLLVGSVLVVIFTTSLNDRRLDVADRPPWSLRQALETFYVNPRANPDFAWAFTSRFMLVMAYAFLVTYQAYYLIDEVGLSQNTVAHADLPRHAGPVRGAHHHRTAHRATVGPAPTTEDLRHRRRSDLRRCVIHHRNSHRHRRVPARHGDRRPGLRHVHGGRPRARRRRAPGRRIGRQGPRRINIAGALPFALAPALAPAVLAISRNSYSVLYLVAGSCALLGALAVVPIRRVR